MKKLLLALAMVAGSQAMAAFPSATPLWACKLKATAVHDNRFYVLIKGGEVNAYGTMKCRSLTGETASQPVSVTIRQIGIGIGFGFPVANSTLDILSLKAGVATPAGMYGQYSIQAGPGLTLLGVRVAVEGGADLTPGEGIAGNLQLVVEQMAGIGLDVSGSVMEIAPASRR